jgi:hypothetical protein
MFMSADQRALVAVNQEQHRKMREHRERCRNLRPLASGEAERLMKSFMEAGGTIKACPTRYVLPVA